MKKILRILSLLVSFISISSADQPHTESYSVVIIGGGLAGHSAALYLSRAKTDHALIEGESMHLGGQMIKAIYENIPGYEKIMGVDYFMNIQSQLKKLGQTIFISDTALSIAKDGKHFTIDLSSGKKIQARTIVIATGAQPNKLGVEGEEKYLGKGVAVCALCDAAAFKDKRVVIIGGGYEALRELGLISKYTQLITIVNKSLDISGPKMLKNFADENKKLKILHNTTAIDIIGNGEEVTGVKVRHNDTQQEETIPTDGVFIAIGWMPATKEYKTIVAMNRKGEIITNNTATDVPGIFAAGDCSSESYHQALIAAAQGYEAAMNAEKYNCNKENSDVKVCE